MAPQALCHIPRYLENMHLTRFNLAVCAKMCRFVSAFRENTFKSFYLQINSMWAIFVVADAFVQHLSQLHGKVLRARTSGMPELSLDLALENTQLMDVLLETSNVNVPKPRRIFMLVTKFIVSFFLSK